MTAEDDFVGLIGKASTALCDVIDALCIARFHNSKDEKNGILFLHNLLLNLVGNMLLSTTSNEDYLDKHAEDFKVNLDTWLKEAKEAHFKTKEKLQ